MFGANFNLDGDLGKAANTAQKGYHTHQLNQNLQSGNYVDAAQNARHVYQLEQSNPTPNGGLTSAAQSYVYDQFQPSHSANSYQTAGSLQTGNYSQAAHNTQSFYPNTYDYGNDGYGYSYGNQQEETAINSKPKNIGWSDVSNFAGSLAGKSSPPPPPPPKNDLASLAGNLFGGSQQQQPAPQQSGLESVFGSFLGGHQQPAPQPQQQQQGFEGALNAFLGGQQQPPPKPQPQGFEGALGNLLGGGQQQQPQQQSGLGALAGLFSGQEHQQSQPQGWGAAAQLLGGQGGGTGDNAAAGADALNTISALAGGSQNLPKDVQNTQASLNFYNNYNKGNYLEAGKNAQTLWENHQAGGEGASTNPITQLSNQWKGLASGQASEGSSGGFNYGAVINPLLSRLGGFGSKGQGAQEAPLSAGGPRNIASGNPGLDARANVQTAANDQYYDYSSQPQQQDQYYSYDYPQHSDDQGYYYANDDWHPQGSNSNQNQDSSQQYHNNQYSQPDYYTYEAPSNSQTNQGYYRNEQTPANNQNYYDYSSKRS